MHFEDEYFMRVALALARRGLGRTSPNPSVGCVIVKNGVIIAVARTADGGRPHAETQALAIAGQAARGASVYVTLEPCAHRGATESCAEALRQAGVKRVVVACTDPDPRTSGKGIEILRLEHLDVEEGVCKQDAEKTNNGFFFKLLNNRPLVTLKMAISADGKISASKGQRTQISGDLAQRYTHLLRSFHDSLLVGIETVLVDNPLLTCRLPGHKHVMTRIILDGRLGIPRESMVVQGAKNDPVLVFHRSGPVDKAVDLKRMGCELIETDPHDLKSVLSALAARGHTRMLVEGGAQVSSSFLGAGFVDEVQLITSAVTLGKDGLEAFPSGHPAAFGFKIQKTRALGEDLLEIWGRED